MSRILNFRGQNGLAVEADVLRNDDSRKSAEDFDSDTQGLLHSRLRRPSAQWLVGHGGSTELAVFGPVDLGKAYTGFMSSNYATIGSHVESVGSFKNIVGDKAWRSTMVCCNYGANEDASKLSSSGSSFTVARYP